ncbi:MAG: hypothetical protein V4485_05320, partial [Pseudomonadota bacterium]
MTETLSSKFPSASTLRASSKYQSDIIKDQPDFTTHISSSKSEDSSAEAISKKIAETENLVTQMMIARSKNMNPLSEKNEDAAGEMAKMQLSLAQTKASLMGAQSTAKLAESMTKSALMQAKEFQGQNIGYDDSVRSNSGGPVTFNYDLRYKQSDLQGSTRGVSANITILNEEGVAVFRKKARD